MTAEKEGVVPSLSLQSLATGLSLGPGILAPGEPNVVGLWASAGWADYFSFSFASGVAWARAPLVMAELQVAGKVVAKRTNQR